MSQVMTASLPSLQTPYSYCNLFSATCGIQDVYKIYLINQDLPTYLPVTANFDL